MKILILLFLAITFSISSTKAQQTFTPEGELVSEGKYLIDKNGTILNFGRPYSYIEYFSDGLAPVQNGRIGWGFIDKTGKEVIKAKYKSVEPFKNGRALIQVKDSKYSWIDKNGKEILKLNYYLVWGQKEGLFAIAESNDKCGYIDTTGKVVIPFEYTNAGSFSEGLAFVTTTNKSYFIDKTGKIFLDIPFEYASPFAHGLSIVSMYPEPGTGIIDKTGKLIFPLSKDPKIEISNGIIKAWPDDADDFHYYDSTGKEISKPDVFLTKYDLNKVSWNDYTEFKIEGIYPLISNVGQFTYYGYADSTGKAIVNPMYFHITAFDQNRAVVWVVNQEYSEKVTQELESNLLAKHPEYNKETDCRMCWGNGMMETPQECPYCSGKGSMKNTSYQATDRVTDTKKNSDGSTTIYYVPGGWSVGSSSCSHCNGSGKTMIECLQCGGTGAKTD